MRVQTFVLFFMLFILVLNLLVNPPIIVLIQSVGFLTCISMYCLFTLPIVISDYFSK
jgi:hypothetical protein